MKLNLLQIFEKNKDRFRIDSYQLYHETFSSE